MSERNKDDIANALHGLSSGDHVEPDPPEGSGTGQAHHFDAAAAPLPSPIPAAPPQRPPAAPLRATPQPVPPAPAGSAAPPPASAKPVFPPMRPRPQPQPLPPSAVRPQGSSAAASPTARPPSPVRAGRVSRTVLPPGAKPPSSPASPNFTPPGGPRTIDSTDADSDVETTNVQPVDEDDVVIVPAAPLSALGPRAHHRPAAAHVPMFKTLQFRRTAIPVLLTTGAILLSVAGMKFVVNPDSALATLPVGMCVALVGAGAVLLAIAALNMAQVRHQLAAEKAAQKAAAPGKK